MGPSEPADPAPATEALIHRKLVKGEVYISAADLTSALTLLEFESACCDDAREMGIAFAMVRDIVEEVERG